MTVADDRIHCERVPLERDVGVAAFERVEPLQCLRVPRWIDAFAASSPRPVRRSRILEEANMTSAICACTGFL